MCLAKNLKYLRLKHGYSQDYIAEIFGYKSYTTIQKWESGDAEPSVEKLRKLANLYNITMNELLTIDIENEKYDQYEEHLKDNPELLELYQKINNNNQMLLLFDKTKDLTPKEMEHVLKIIDTFNKETM